MGWWRKIKTWQKGGILIGLGHFLIYMSLFFISLGGTGGESGIVYLMIFMTWPWVGILLAFGIGPGTYGSMLILGVFSAIMYGIVGMILVLLVLYLKRGKLRGKEEI